MQTSPLLALGLALTGLTTFATSQAQTATDIISRVDASQRGAKDISFRLSGTASVQGSNQKIDLNIQSIPAANLARIVFNAPDSLADNIVVVDKAEIRNYLYLTNQVTVTPLTKATGQAGLSGLDFSQISNLSALLKNYDVRLLGSSGAAGNRVFQLEGTAKAAGVNDGKARVWISEAGWRPTRVQWLDSGNKVVADLSFNNYKTNAGLSATTLRMLPKNAEVVRQ
ncbi:outer membrane lipoprotein carrier protein LolA [Deinococcus sonorensis]|uniref:Outer membrane lipoprotein carrier protein LolA n=2 Tax=Deinococcus sonorensis TaxID=309891 RepID=A0AAU7U9P1_9DEIO